MLCRALARCPFAIFRSFAVYRYDSGTRLAAYSALDVIFIAGALFTVSSAKTVIERLRLVANWWIPNGDN